MALVACDPTLFRTLLSTQVYETPSPGLCILHAQVERTDDKVAEIDLPPFLEVNRRLDGEADEKMFGAYRRSIILDPST